ncbi:glycosyltransferase [Halorubrum ezzemoulense]|uniref:glycosyltransferase n=1 Tax=Halorubrum ezzemoulense TaxID=337243 RepID=UPI003CCC0E20
MSSSQVLIVSFHAPPENSSAAGRIQALLDYLPDMGWMPTVLTAETNNSHNEQYSEYVVETSYPGDVHSILRQRTPFLNDEYVPQESPHLVKDDESSRTLKEKLSKNITNSIKSAVLDTVAYPDPQRFWKNRALRQGRQLLENGEFDLIVSTSPPATAHLIGNKLANEFQIPWIADFRDLWTQYHYNETNLIRKFFESRLQKRVVKDTTHITAATEPFAEKLQSLHKKPATSIYSGFQKMATRDLTDKFTITYTGGLYDGRRDPTKLFMAIDELESTTNVDPSNILIRFFGVQAPWLTDLIGKYDLDSTVQLTKWIPKNKILEKQKESQVLLSIQWDHPMERMVLPGKIFEYLAAQRPVLAYGGPADSVVGSILDRTSAGVKVNSVSEIMEYIETRYREYESKGEVPYHGDKDVINSYHHKETASNFATIFDDVNQNT